MLDNHFKDRYAYIERANDKRLLNEVLKKRQEKKMNDIHSIELKGNNMRFQNMRKDTYTFNDNIRFNGRKNI